MNCPNCGFLLPEDSNFCPYCGTVISDSAQGGEPSPVTESPGLQTIPPSFPVQEASAPACEASAAAVPSPAAAPGAWNPGDAAQHTHQGKKTKQCKACGADIDPHTQKCTVCGKSASRIQPTVLALAAVSAALVCSLVINFLQYGSAVQMQQELEQQLESSNAAIAAQESAILELENQLSETEEELQRSEALLLSTKVKLKMSEKDAHNYGLIRSFLSKPDAGYASDQFFASRSVLILSRTGREQSFSLKTGFSGGEYSIDITGSSADVYFAESSWYGTSTTIRVAPKAAGATYATFSNNLNSQTFRVLVIVTE